MTRIIFFLCLFLLIGCTGRPLKCSDNHMKMHKMSNGSQYSWCSTS